jgi:Aldehyde dehydrogenase family
MCQHRRENNDGQRVQGLRQRHDVAVVGTKALASGPPFAWPTARRTIRPDMKVVREEIFGPVLVASPSSDLDEIARLANDSDYGPTSSQDCWPGPLAVRWLLPVYGLSHAPGRDCNCLMAAGCGVAVAAVWLGMGAVPSMMDWATSARRRLWFLAKSRLTLKA